MKRVDTKELMDQAKDFFRNAKYMPSNYDFLFHTNHFSSPVTIRKRFGTWEKYIDTSIIGSFMEFPDRMFYGGYGQLYTPHIPIVPDPYIYDKLLLWEGIEYDDPLSAKSLYVTKLRAKDIYDVLYEMFGDNVKVQPATRGILIPSFIIDEKYIVASFDTPHYIDHFRRCQLFTRKYEKKYEIINANGVKKNHLQSFIGDMIE